jgi:hypothetical protein
MSDPDGPEPELAEWEKKSVPLSVQIQRLRDRCQHLALLSAIVYLLVNLLRASELYAQQRTTFMIFETQLPTSQIRALLDFDQAWKLSISATVILGVLALPRWQGFLALALVALWEIVIRPVLAI